MATVEVLNPPPMYRIRPYFTIKKVKLPDCMYLLKPVHQLPNLTPSQESTSSALSYLEKRQEWVLSHISQLQERVKDFANELGVGAADVGILQQVNSTGSTQDIVISCPTSTPPYLVRSLYIYISEYVPCTCQVHIHSSASSQANDDHRDFFNDLPRSKHSKTQLRLTLVWKSDAVCPNITMMVSPHNQTPVQGLANVLRYLTREFSPSLYEGQGPQKASEIDSWMDTVSAVLLNDKSSSKEKTSVARKLNSRLGGNEYLVGEQLSLADLYCYWAVCGQGAVKLTKNITDWLTRVYVAVPALGTFPCLCWH